MRQMMDNDILCKTCGKPTSQVLGELTVCLDESCTDMHFYDCKDGSHCKIKESDLNNKLLNE